MTAVSAPRPPATVTSRKIVGGWIGEVRRHGGLVCTCGHPGHVFEHEAMDCVRAMARSIGIVLPRLGSPLETS